MVLLRRRRCHGEHGRGASTDDELHSGWCFSAFSGTISSTFYLAVVLSRVTRVYFVGDRERSRVVIRTDQRVALKVLGTVGWTTDAWA